MASIARSLRVAAPLAKSFAPRAVPLARPAFRAFSTTGLNFGQRRYTKDHEWIDISPDGSHGTVGISAYAAEQLGDVVYVELPEKGEFEQGDAIGAVESVKSASDINAPMNLKITAVNSLLEEKPSTINKLPEDYSEGGGWIARVSIEQGNTSQFDALMDAKAYQDFIGSEH